MVGGERPREAAAVERLQDRRLDLDEAVARRAQRRTALMIRARATNSSRVLLVGDQVELAAAKARLDVAEPVVLVGRRAQRLGEQREVVDAQRQLAAAGAHRDAVDADQVAEVERRRGASKPSWPELVDARVQLDAPGAVDEVEERRAPRSRGAPRAAPRRGGRRRSPPPPPAPRARASTSAIGSTPGNSCGNGSTPSARSRSSFARRAASSSTRSSTVSSLHVREAT